MIKYLLLFVCLGTFPVFGETITLAADGKSNTQIVVGEKPSFVIRYAARELSEFLGRIGKCQVPVVATSNAPVRIYLGDSAPARASGWLPERGKGLISIRQDGTILLAGLDDSGQEEKDYVTFLRHVRDRGTLEATYTFLEKYCGVRWTEPGPAGEFVPEQAVFTLPVVEEQLIPAFTERRTFHFDKVLFPDVDQYGGRDGLWRWALRLRSSSWCEPVCGCHPGGYLELEKNFGKAHPEYFALQPNGTRNFMYLCWTNPDVINFWATLGDAYFAGEPNPRRAGIQMDFWPGFYGVNPQRIDFIVDPYDMYEDFACQCDRCRKFMAEHPENGLSELIWRAIIEIAQKIDAKHPGKMVTTLAYPPKQFIPKDTPMPGNIQVRLTGSGPNPRMAAPESYRRHLELLKDWKKATGKDVPLWIYLVSTFGDGMTGVPEIVPHEFQRFLHDIRSLSNGMFIEYGQPSHTVGNMDLYAMFHLMWDPDLDLDALLDEYCRIQYGAAAPEMRKFFARLEKNWAEVLRLTWGDNSGYAPWYTSDKYRKIVWENVYNPAEIKNLNAILDAASQQVSASGIERRHINLVRRWVVEFMQNERAGLMVSDSEHEAMSELFVGRSETTVQESDWESVPWLPLVSATSHPLANPGRVKLLRDSENFHIRAEFTDPMIARSKTAERSGDNWKNIWEDNEVELFFYAESTGTPIQILINDRGFAALQHLDGKNQFNTGLSFPIRAERTNNGWTLQTSVPHAMTGFGSSGENRFNLIRARNVGELPPEYSTLMPRARKGKWMDREYYGNIRYIYLTERKGTAYDRLAAPPSGNTTSVYRENFDSGVSESWGKWVIPGGKSELSRVADFGHNGRGSLLIDMSKDRPAGKNPGATWFFVHPQKTGERMRVRLYFYAETSRPDARLSLAVAFQNANRTWVKYETLQGAVTVPATPGVWQELSMDITVPDNPDIVYLSIQAGSQNAYPGKIYLDDLEISKVSN